MVKAAEYFDSSARPAQIPAASHQAQAARPAAGSAVTRHSAAPSNAAISGPSGRTQLPVVTPKTGARFSAAAAHSPARAPNSAAVRRYIRKAVSAKRAMKGSRTMIALSLPARCAAPQASHHAIGGWSK